MPRRYLTEQPDPNNENVVGYNNKKCWCARGVLSCGSCASWPSHDAGGRFFLTEMLRAGRATSACAS